MTERRLNIIKIEDEEASAPPYKNRKNDRRQEVQAKFERLWLTDPERFNPLRNCMERERGERTWELLTQSIDFSTNPHTVDIGCAAGVFSRRLRDAGAKVEAIDIAENALKKFREEGADGINLKQETMPETNLPSEEFDLVVCTDLIAEIPEEDYRLFFAELARIIRANGLLICSSPIDIHSIGGVERLKGLAQSEFDIIAERESYHALYLRLKRIINTPSLFIAGYKNCLERKKTLAHLSGLKHVWYKLNTSYPLVLFWFLPALLMRAIKEWLSESKKALFFLEKVCRFKSDKEGVSHYLFVAKRRPLECIDREEIPVKRLGKKEIWN